MSEREHKHEHPKNDKPITGYVDEHGQYHAVNKPRKLPQLPEERTDGREAFDALLEKAAKPKE